MNPQAPISPKQAAKELVNLNAPFVDLILKHFEEMVNKEPLIGETTDSTLTRVYRHDGKVDLLRDLRRFFFPNGL